MDSINENISEVGSEVGSQEPNATVELDIQNQIRPCRMKWATSNLKWKILEVRIKMQFNLDTTRNKVQIEFIPLI